MDESDNSGPTTPKKNNKDKTQYNDLNNKFSILNSNKDSKKVKLTFLEHKIQFTGPTKYTIWYAYVLETTQTP